jgi:signal transduction histidine kinase
MLFLASGAGLAARLLIESENFGQIFQAFKRLYGKELTICKEIVELGGGSMWVESELGQGSSFKFTLPTAEFALPAVTPR